MKDEIKEILEALKPQDEEFTKAGIKEYPLVLSLKEQKILRDYITNLQKENERLKENAIHNDKVVDKAKWNEMIYKSRIDKVIHFICEEYKPQRPTTKEEEIILNILKGSDKEC